MQNTETSIKWPIFTSPNIISHLKVFCSSIRRCDVSAKRGEITVGYIEASVASASTLTKSAPFAITRAYNYYKLNIILVSL